jgi:hypothetical protein
MHTNKAFRLSHFNKYCAYLCTNSMTTEIDSRTVQPSFPHHTATQLVSIQSAVNYHQLSFILTLFHVASTQRQDQQSFKTTPGIIEDNTSLITHGAEPFFRRYQLCSYSRNSQHFREPKGSLLCSQEPSTGPYPEPDQSNLYHPILFL